MPKTQAELKAIAQVEAQRLTDAFFSFVIAAHGVTYTPGATRRLLLSILTEELGPDAETKFPAILTDYLNALDAAQRKPRYN